MSLDPAADIQPLLALLEAAEPPVSRLARRLRRALEFGTLLEECERALRRGAPARILVARACRAVAGAVQRDAPDERFEALLARLARDPLPEVWVPAARAFGLHAVRQGRTGWILAGGPGGSLQDTFRRRVYPALAAAAGAGWSDAVRWLEQGLQRSGDVWDKASVLLGLEELVGGPEQPRAERWIARAAGDSNRILRWQLAGVLARGRWPASLEPLLLETLDRLHRQTLLDASDLTNLAFEAELRESLAVLAGRLGAAALLEQMAGPARYGPWGALAARRALGRAHPDDSLEPTWQVVLWGDAGAERASLTGLWRVLHEDGWPAAARVAAADALCRAIREGGEADHFPPGWPRSLIAGEADAAGLAALLADLPQTLAAAALECRRGLAGEPAAMYAAVRVHEQIISCAGHEVERTLAALRDRVDPARASLFDQLVAATARERAAAAERWIDAALPVRRYWLTQRVLDWIHRTPELQPQPVFERLAAHWACLPDALLGRRIPALLADLHERLPEARRGAWARQLEELATLPRGDEVLARCAAWTGEDPQVTRRITVRRQVARIGRYHVLEEIGRGGFGTVYRGVHPVLGIDVAIKVPRADLLDPADLETFLDEARLLAELTARGGAQHVLSIYDADHSYSGSMRLTYVVMEYVAEGSLYDRITRDGPLAPELAAEIVRQSALGVEAAHRLDPPLVHRDVKPANLLLKQTPFGLQVRVADFGGAARARDPRARLLCSIGYTAPEVFDGVIAPGVDIYGLGAVLYDCLAGQPPFPKSTLDEYRAQVTTRLPPPLQEVAPGVPSELAAIAERAMARDAAARFPTAADLARELERFIGSLGVGASG